MAELGSTRGLETSYVVAKRASSQELHEYEDRGVRPLRPVACRIRVNGTLPGIASSKALQCLSGICERAFHETADGLSRTDGVASPYFYKDLTMHLETCVEAVSKLDLLQKDRHDRVEHHLEVRIMSGPHDGAMKTQIGFNRVRKRVAFFRHFLQGAFDLFQIVRRRPNGRQAGACLF